MRIQNATRAVVTLAVAGTVAAGSAPAMAATNPVMILTAPACSNITTSTGTSTWQQQLEGLVPTTTYSYVVDYRPVAVLNYRGTATVAMNAQLLYLGVDRRWHTTNQISPTALVTSSYPVGSWLKVQAWSTGSPTFNSTPGRVYAVQTTTIWMDRYGHLIASNRNSAAATPC